ncbi:MAG: hypothetical protein JNJ58_10425 [Chitinophagaceae bacterium]|nr:hypothetical protein [Chitinophagaceae bacterium]
MQYLSTIFKLSLLAIIFVIPLQGQAQENSPYSRYILGNLKSIENVAFRGMGGVCIADDHSLIANPSNPATYTGLRMTSYQVGLEGNLVTVKNSSVSNRTGSATLSYVNIGFPLSKKLGLSFGLLPQTRSKYSMAKSDSIPGISRVNSSYYGGGGIQKIYIGAAYKISDFSVGLNTGYTFGNLVNSSESSFTDSLKILSNNITARTTMGGFFWQVGALMNKKLKKEYTLRLGVTYTGAQSLNAKKEQYWESFGGDLSNPDYVGKVDSVMNLKGKVKIPALLGVGAIFSNGDFWQVGVDFRSSDWTNFSSYGNADSSGAYWNIRLGGAITPDVNAVNNFWKKVTYRVGAYTGQDILKFGDNNIKNMGVTAGVGLPIRRTQLSIGQLNAGIDIGKRGTTDNGLVREGYTRFSFGITFNDRWFIKRRYD